MNGIVYGILIPNLLGLMLSILSSWHEATGALVGFGDICCFRYVYAILLVYSYAPRRALQSPLSAPYALIAPPRLPRFLHTGIQVCRHPKRALSLPSAYAK
jgi:hypothetical protein